MRVEYYGNGATRRNAWNISINDSTLMWPDTFLYNQLIDECAPADYSIPWGLKLSRPGYVASWVRYIDKVWWKTIAQDGVKIGDACNGETISTNTLAEAVWKLEELEKWDTTVKLYASWEKCPAWYYCPKNAYKEKCLAWYYCPEWSSSPTICPCGSYCPSGSSSPIKCLAWKYSSTWSSSCKTAAKWYYANSSCSQTACTNKDVNSTYTDNSSSNSCPWGCNAGYYKTNKISSTSNWRGSSSSYSSSGICKPCEAGTYSITWSKWENSCLLCPDWFYCPWWTDKKACPSPYNHSLKRLGLRYSGDSSRSSSSWHWNSGKWNNSNTGAKSQTDCYAEIPANYNLNSIYWNPTPCYGWTYAPRHVLYYWYLSSDYRYSSCHAVIKDTDWNKARRAKNRYWEVEFSDWKSFDLYWDAHNAWEWWQENRESNNVNWWCYADEGNTKFFIPSRDNSNCKCSWKNCPSECLGESHGHR